MTSSSALLVIDPADDQSFIITTKAPPLPTGN
jgi:hypothetical protein